MASPQNHANCFGWFIPNVPRDYQEEKNRMRMVRFLNGLTGTVCAIAATAMAGRDHDLKRGIGYVVSISLGMTGIVIILACVMRHPQVFACLTEKIAKVVVELVMYGITFGASLLFHFEMVLHYVIFCLSLAACYFYICTFPNRINLGVNSYILSFVVGLCAALPHHQLLIGSITYGIVAVIHVYGTWFQLKQKAFKKLEDEYHAEKRRIRGEEAARSQSAEGGSGNV